MLKHQTAQLGFVWDQKLGTEVSLLVDIIRDRVRTLRGNLTAVVEASVPGQANERTDSAPPPEVDQSFCQTYAALGRNITACHTPGVMWAGVSASAYLEFLIENFGFVLHLPG